MLTSQPVELEQDLSYIEKPVEILGRKEQVLRTKTIPLVKVLWRSQTVEEATWELEEDMQDQYPSLFTQGM